VRLVISDHHLGSKKDHFSTIPLDVIGRSFQPITAGQKAKPQRTSVEGRSSFRPAR
jgi:hypothetical protein